MRTAGSSAARPRVPRARAPRLPALALAALVALIAGGCEFLPLLGVGPDPSFDPDEPLFPIDATYTTGSATIELEGETITLDELDGEATYSEDYGTDVGWTDGEAWHLTFYGGGAYSGLGPDGYLSFDRVEGGEHWVIYDAARCIVTTEVLDETGVEGSAICRGLEWSDFFDASMSGIPEPIEGEPAFDADVTFEAHAE